jgi:hypothetical protein
MHESDPHPWNLFAPIATDTHALIVNYPLAFHDVALDMVIQFII